MIDCLLPGRGGARTVCRRGLAVVAAIGSAAVAAVGCGPTEACERYVQCQQAYDPQVSTTAYDEGGACWENPRTAQTCDQQCAEALDALAAVPGAPGACKPAAP